MPVNGQLLQDVMIMANLLLDPIIKDFKLLCSHRKDSIERETILLRSRHGRGRAQLHSLEVLIKAYAYFPALARFDCVWRPETEHSLMSIEVQWKTLLCAYRQTTLILVILAIMAIYDVNRSKGSKGRRVYMKGMGSVKRFKFSVRLRSEARAMVKCVCGCCRESPSQRQGSRSVLTAQHSLCSSDAGISSVGTHYRIYTLLCVTCTKYYIYD